MALATPEGTFRCRLRSYRTTVVAYLALFLVLTGGTAVALNGSNTVFSDDITNGQVKSADIGATRSAGGGSSTTRSGGAPRSNLTRAHRGSRVAVIAGDVRLSLEEGTRARLDAKEMT